MYFTTMTHRDELFDLALRWLNDDFRADDGAALSRIFLYESVVSAAVVGEVFRFLQQLYGSSLRTERVRQKQVLRRRLVDCLPASSERIRQLILSYEDDPEYFFPRLPIDGLLVLNGVDRLAAIGRIKRLTRVAEKISFRLVDALFREIKDEARLQAEQRAERAGTPLVHLLSTAQEMQDDFTAAEAAVAARFRRHNVVIEPDAVTVNDLLGFKIVDEPEQLARIPEQLAAWPAFSVVEIEHHRGDYNAVNLLVEVRLPVPIRLLEKTRGFDWTIAGRRGLDPARMQAEFASYLASGSDSVRIELILTTYDELMESEFGRSMHELRILRLRQRQAYCGPIAQNASFLIEYLLTLALSPTVNIAELPVKMYGRYLPETIAIAKCALCGNRSDDGLLQSFSLVAGA
ncbi:hypothetical protein [Desulfofustis limnaeus]|jgi:hypothetical protein|uniref:Uncharacterized protein n=1 Tax=Desulfofustis limnaeus TaxID=2740163 RepID=A0ABN6M4C8_9BACT|nr:hypothetical protein [Desulfofustis limnaeus]MDX9896384.1 hypothetical protein [Desulfofustis sp.]BDD87758.1 hypothetical protein DPPLL_21230 [Desulfofustis limnaeus]